MEIWKDIPGYVGAYQASSLGQIRSVPRKWVKHYKIKKQRLGNWRASYMVVSLNAEGINVSVHRLIASAFHGPPTRDKPEVNHIDGNKLNNAANNLEWVNSSENRLHAYRIGLHKQTQINRLPKIIGTANENCKLTEKQILDLYKRFHRKENRHKLAAEFKVSRRTVYNIGQHKTLSSITKHK